jgi:hypothetical protein
MLLGESAPDGLQIIARIEPGRDLADLLAQRLAVAQIGGTGQRIDLCAGIVDVVLAGHGVAGELQQVGERIAEHGAAPMADMHRPGRVGGDVFDVDLLAVADGGTAIVGPLLQDRHHHALPEGRHEAHVEEARAGYLDLLDVGIRFQLGGQLVGDVARLHLGRLGQHHGSVAREVAVRCLARRRHLDIGQVEPSRQRPLARQCAQRFDDAALHQRVYVHHDHPAFSHVRTDIERAPG